MAKLKVYAVHDTQIGAYARPFFMRTRGEALRSWQDACNDSTMDMCKYPHDYALFELAEFDEETGTFNNLMTPMNLGLANQFKKETIEKRTAEVHKLNQDLNAAGAN